MKAARTTILLIILLLAVIALPQASATNTCTIRPAGACMAGEEPIASTSATGNAHAAPASHPDFKKLIKSGIRIMRNSPH